MPKLDVDDRVFIKELFERLGEDIRRISYGSSTSPMGLEMVAMALHGEGTDCSQNVALSLSEIAEALNNVAEAIRDTSR